MFLPETTSEQRDRDAFLLILWDETTRHRFVPNQNVSSKPRAIQKASLQEYQGSISASLTQSHSVRPQCLILFMSTGELLS